MNEEISAFEKVQKAVKNVCNEVRLLSSWVNKTAEFFNDNRDVGKQFTEWLREKYPDGM